MKKETFKGRVRPMVLSDVDLSGFTRLPGQGVRWLAAVLCVFALTLALFAGGQALWLRSVGAYARDGQSHVHAAVTTAALKEEMYAVVDQLERVDVFSGDTLSTVLQERDPNFFFVIIDQNGRKQYESPGQGKAQAQFIMDLYVADRYFSSSSSHGSGGSRQLMVTGFVREELTPEGNIYAAVQRADTLYSGRDTYLVTSIVFAAAGGVLLGLLCWWAGRREGQEEAVLLKGDELPLELAILLLAADGVWLWSRLAFQDWQAVLWTRSGPGFMLLSALGAALLVALILSLVRRWRAGTIQKERLIVPTLLRRAREKTAAAGEGVKSAGAGSGRLLDRAFSAMPLIARAVVAFLLFAALEVVTVEAWHSSTSPLLWVLVKLLEGALLIWAVMALRTLLDGCSRLARGDWDEDVPLEQLWGGLRGYGETLNALRETILAAVEKQLSTERLKTDLITGAAKEIQPPLDRIQAAAALLAASEPPTEEAKAALEELQKQTAQLKELTDSLAETAEAAAGKLTADLQPVALNDLLRESTESFADALGQSELDLVLTAAPEEPVIRADAVLFRRVLRSLLTGVGQYAQPGTRVYLTGVRAERAATVTLRSVSAAPLNLTSEELLSQLAQGDTGKAVRVLDLALAQSLTRLQGGTFELVIDGDLVKVVLTFPLSADRA